MQLRLSIFRALSGRAEGKKGLSFFFIFQKPLNSAAECRLVEHAPQFIIIKDFQTQFIFPCPSLLSLPVIGIYAYWFQFPVLLGSKPMFKVLKLMNRRHYS
jgi:hypothetical protein